jgi:aspartate aminotransferase
MAIGHARRKSKLFTFHPIKIKGAVLCYPHERLTEPSPRWPSRQRRRHSRHRESTLPASAPAEPDFDTLCPHKGSGYKGPINDNFTRYTPVTGIDPLKDAIIDKFARDNGLAYKREEVMVSCGGKHGLYNLFQALFQEGDEVIVPTPFWVSTRR